MYPLQDNWCRQSLGRPHDGNGALFIIHKILCNCLTFEDYTITYSLLKSDGQLRLDKHCWIEGSRHDCRIWDTLCSLFPNFSVTAVCVLGMNPGISRIKIISLMLAFFRFPLFSLSWFCLSPRWKGQALPQGVIIKRAQAYGYHHQHVVWVSGGHLCLEGKKKNKNKCLAEKKLVSPGVICFTVFL